MREPSGINTLDSRIRGNDGFFEALSITDENRGFSVVRIYRVKDGKRVYIKEAGGISPVTLADENQLKPQRKLEAEYAPGWLKNIMAEAFA